jgi:O-antigen/teichoic acid export membrane protein
MRCFFCRWLTPRVVLTAVLIAFSLGLLFEGFMIGPEYNRYKPPGLVLLVLVLYGAAVFWLWFYRKNPPA